ncbi:MAG: DMT family transporter [Pseudomonadota bacterium]
MPHSTPRAKLFLGIAFLVSGLCTLSLLDATSKLLTLAGYHVVMITWMRYTLNTLVMAVTVAPLYRRRTGKSILRSALPRLQIIRATLLLISTLAFFSVLKLVPLAEGTAMNFCAPLMVLAVAPWLLGEKSYTSRWIAVIVGFTGMLIVVRPGGSIAPLGVVFGILSASAAAAIAILNRKLNQVDDPLITLLYSGMVGMCASTLLVPFFWSTHTPPLQEWLLLGSMGVTSTIGHFLLLSAYKHAEASVLSPFVYLQVIPATTMGWLVFSQLPDSLTALGIAIICASGIGIAYIEHRRLHPDKVKAGAAPP